MGLNVIGFALGAFHRLGAALNRLAARIEELDEQVELRMSSDFWEEVPSARTLPVPPAVDCPAAGGNGSTAHGSATKSRGRLADARSR